MIHYIGATVLFSLLAWFAYFVLVLCPLDAWGTAWIDERRPHIESELRARGYEFFDGPMTRDMSPDEATYGLHPWNADPRLKKYIQSRKMKRLLQKIERKIITPTVAYHYVQQHGTLLHREEPTFKIK